MDSMGAKLAEQLAKQAVSKKVDDSMGQDGKKKRRKTKGASKKRKAEKVNTS